MSEPKDEQTPQLNQKDKPSIADQLNEFYSKKIDEGFQVRDRATAIDLRKMGQTELKIGDGWNAHAKKILSKVLKEKGLVLADEAIKERVGNIILNLPPPEKTIGEHQEEKMIQQPTQSIPKEPIIERRIFDPQVEKQNQQAFKEIFFVLGEVYQAAGIIQGTEKFAIQEMTMEDFTKRCDRYAERLGSFCYRRAIEIPMLVEVAALACTAFILFGLPIIQKLYADYKTAKTEKDLAENESRLEG